MYMTSEVEHPQVQVQSVLETLSDALGITASTAQHLVFVYSAPKVGSTTLVSSLRLFCSHRLHVVHIHDEAMLSRITSLPPAFRVHDLIAHHRDLGKKVHVIDVYRTPIERKISLFFEHLATLHFNNTEERVNRYSVDRVMRRFAGLFPHLATDDRFLETYPISRGEADGESPPAFAFNHAAKRLRVEQNGITYLKLRLQDADEHWGRILSEEFGCSVHLVRDNDTARGPLGDLVSRFRDAYRIPVDVLESSAVLACPHFRFYLTAEEQAAYATKWRARSSTFTSDWGAPWTREQFLFYEHVSRENAYQDDFQTTHYVDEGCRCKACSWQRAEMAARVARGETTVLERLTHETAKKKWIEQCAARVKSANQFVADQQKKNTKGGTAAAAVGRIMDTAVARSRR